LSDFCDSWDYNHPPILGGESSHLRSGEDTLMTCEAKEQLLSPQIGRKTRFEDLPDFLSVEETRRYFGLGRSTIYELLRRKELAHVRFGRVIRIPRIALEKFLLGKK
jgi:excisionase family DNA binding protein